MVLVCGRVGVIVMMKETCVCIAGMGRRGWDADTGGGDVMILVVMLESRGCDDGSVENFVMNLQNVLKSDIDVEIFIVLCCVCVSEFYKHWCFEMV